MFAQSLLLLASCFALGCSDASAAAGDAQAGDDGLIAPEGLQVTARPGGCGVLSLQTLTLRRGTSHGELYATLHNDGQSPACSPVFSVELFDEAEQSLASGLGGILVHDFYRLTNGSGTVAACVGPGDVGMVAIMDLPAELAIPDVHSVVFGCNFWMLEVEPIAGISISQVHSVARPDGAAYAGALVNGLDVALSSPAVAVFSLNGAGRALSVAFGSGTVDVPPGGSWQFETTVVSEAGVANAAYPTHG